MVRPNTGSLTRTEKNKGGGGRSGRRAKEGGIVENEPLRLRAPGKRRNAGTERIFSSKGEVSGRKGEGGEILGLMTRFPKDKR